MCFFFVLSWKKHVSHLFFFPFCCPFLFISFSLSRIPFCFQDIIPYLRDIVRGHSAATTSTTSTNQTFAFDALDVHLQATRGILAVLRQILNRDHTRQHDHERMLDTHGQHAVFDICLSSVQYLSGRGGGMDALEGTGAQSRGSTRDLLILTTEATRRLLSEVDLWRRAPSAAAPSASIGHLFEQIFRDVVPELLRQGQLREVREMGERYAHYNTLYQVCEYVDESDRSQAEALMQQYMEDERIRTTDTLNKEYPKTFPDYVYDRL